MEHISIILIGTSTPPNQPLNAVFRQSRKLSELAQPMSLSFLSSLQVERIKLKQMQKAMQTFISMAMSVSNMLLQGDSSLILPPGKVSEVKLPSTKTFWATKCTDKKIITNVIACFLISNTGQPASANFLKLRIPLEAKNS